MAEDKLIESLNKIAVLSVPVITEASYHLERYNPPNRGAEPTEQASALNAYISYFWKMHNDKQNDAYKYLFDYNPEYFKNDISIIDWGCGQGLASFSFIEFLKSKGLSHLVSRQASIVG